MQCIFSRNAHSGKANVGLHHSLSVQCYIQAVRQRACEYAVQPLNRNTQLDIGCVGMQAEVQRHQLQHALDNTQSEVSCYT